MSESVGGDPSEASTPGSEGRFDTPPSDSISPARNPTKGGDFDVVKVSRIGSIAIKSTGPTKGYSYKSSLGNGEKKFHRKKQSINSASIVEKEQSDSDVSPPSVNKEDGKEIDEYSEKVVKQQSETARKSTNKKEATPGRKPMRKRALRVEEEEEDSSDEETVPGNDPMDVIGVSPYEGNANAERDVKLFEDLHSLLTEGSIKASKILGDLNARIMVRAYRKSKMR